VPQLDELGNAKAALNCDEQERPISTANPCILGNGVDERLRLALIEICDCPLVVSLCWDSQYAAAAQRMRGLQQDHVAEEGADGGQPNVPRARRVTSLSFKRLQKARNERRA
jgi:hypothetical protein